MRSKCPLCKTEAENFYEDRQKYFRCPTCHAVFVAQEDLPDTVAEKERYKLHNDNAEDAGYKKFVSPITTNIEKDFSKEAKGLDFGSGTSQIITKVMQKKGYDIRSYDPYFHPNRELLKKRYDYIAACEVIEHFYHPAKEFALLKSMLKKDAKLYLMTDIYDERVAFSSWYYKNDPTHVFFYTKKSFEWIQKRFAFANFLIKKRLIVFSN